MPQPKPLDADAPGVDELLRDYAALRTWEVLRAAGSVATIAELSAATALDRAIVQRQIDLLERHGLVQVVRARKPRRSIGYRVATDRIVVVFDDRDSAAAARRIESSEEIGREFARCLDAHGDPEFHSKAGFRFRMHSMQRFSREDLEELRRRLLPVIEFINAPRTAPSPARRRSKEAAPPSTHCNQAVSIVLEPLVGALLPLPLVWVTPRSKWEQADAGAVARTRLGDLAPREREVALALADGLPRAHVAKRLGLSVNTVSTVARRVYRKLGVTNQAGLAARLAGAARKELGEPA